MKMVSEQTALVKHEIVNPRQIRHSEAEKAAGIAYMIRREQEEKKSNATWYSEFSGISRSLLYKWRHHFTASFSDQRPGPKARTAAVTVTTSAQAKSAAPVAASKPKELDERVVRTILQAAIGPMSERQTRELVATACGINVSKRQIKAIVIEHGRKARRWLAELGWEALIAAIAIDEIFCGRQPVLTGVDLRSFAVVVCQLEPQRDHVTWGRVLARFPALELVASDRATGIIKAVAHADVWHQFDLFHFKREAHRQLRRLESRAYGKIEAEYAAERKLRTISNAACRQTWLTEYDQRRQAANLAIGDYDRVAKALRLAEEALDLFDRDDRPLNIEQQRKNLQRAATWLAQATNEPPIRNLAAQLRDPRLSLYLATLQARILAMNLRWQPGQPAMSRHKVWSVIARYWRWQQANNHVYRIRDESKAARQTRRAAGQQRIYATQFVTLLELQQVRLALRNFDEVFAAVTTALDQTFRASSLVEAFNSHVRVCQQVKKNFGQDFLALLMLHWNMTPFEQGKRKGTSPFQILGLQGPHETWLDCLRAK